MGIEVKGLDILMESINKTLKNMPEQRKVFHAKAGKIILRKVKEKTPYGSNRKSGTHLKDAIIEIVGSGGGYVSVKPDYKKAPHAYLVEKGHREFDFNGIPTGNFVKGVHMFENGAKDSESELENLAEKFVDEIARGLS